MSILGSFDVVYDNRLPPCNAQCPSGHNIQGWLAEAAKGEYRKAWEIMMENNPLPSAMGRVCYHTCEGACNRKEFDQSVNIHAIERLVGDMAIKESWSVATADPTGKNVLIIGSGPAGLSAAYHLALLGHAVTIAEAGPRAGGMMAFGIPSYRLPRDILDAEVERIVKMGVTLKTNMPIKDVPAAMQEGGFDACFAAFGAHVAKRVDIPGTNRTSPTVRVLDAVSVLREMETGVESPKLGRNVAVYGGGNTALDLARTAVRLGAEQVRIVYRRSRAKMPAHAFEVEEALEEGITLNDLRTIWRVGAGEMTLEIMELDSDGWPISTGKSETVAVDTVVLALGQDVDASPLNGLVGVAVRKDGTVETDEYFQTGYPGLFCGGDMTSGDRTVTTAIGHGKKAARNIDAWLRGVSVSARSKRTLATYDRINETFYRRSKAATENHISVDARRSSFEEVTYGLEIRIALREAKRCLSCGNCILCDECLKLCPDRAITKPDSGGNYQVDQAKCRECGVCVAQCPCGAIHRQVKSPLNQTN